MISAYLIVYKGSKKLHRHFTVYQIAWFEKHGKDLLFKSDGDIYLIKNTTPKQFKDKFKKGE